MSESLEIAVQVNLEARGVEADFDVDIAGCGSVSALTYLVNEQWSDYVFENEQDMDKQLLSITDLEDEDYDVIDENLPSYADWMIKSAQGIDPPEAWEWEWIEYFGESSTVDLEVGYAAWSLDISPDTVEEAYQGEFNTDADFAENMAKGLRSVNDSAEWPNYCIDWEWAAKELMMDYTEHDGHYFRYL